MEQSNYNIFGPTAMSKSEEHFYERFLIVHQILEMVQKHGVHFYNGGGGVSIICD